MQDSTFLRNVGRPAEVPDYMVWYSRWHSVLTDISINNDLCFGGAGDRFSHRSGHTHCNADSFWKFHDRFLPNNFEFSSILLPFDVILSQQCLLTGCAPAKRRGYAHAPPTVLYTFQQGPHWPELTVYFLHSIMFLKWVEHTVVRKWVYQRPRRADCI